MLFVFFRWNPEENMLNIKSFGIIGGDKRQLYCARSIADDGYGVFINGFDQCENTSGLKNVSLQTVLDHSDALILPMPLSKDGIGLFAPFSSSPHNLKELANHIVSDKPVFCGMYGKADNKILSGIVKDSIICFQLDFLHVLRHNCLHCAFCFKESKNEKGT